MHRRGRYTYGTKGTPTTEALETAWTALAGAAGTVLAPSGLAAVTLALMSCLKAGDHLLMTDSVYQPDADLLRHVLKRFGVETTYYDPLIGAGIEALFGPNTAAVFTEAPGSQTFEMQDIPAIAEVAHRHGAAVLMDNTWATPLFFPPHAHGVDLAIEAGTKYLSGGSDLLLGLVSANERWFRPLRATYDAFANVRRARRTSSSPCAACAPWRCACASTSARRSPWRAGSPSGPEVARVLHPALAERSRATPSGSATSRARRGCSRSS